MKVSTAQITEVNGPLIEPVSLAEAKLHGRVTWTDEDSLISTYIKAARRYCENYLQRALIPRDLRADLPQFYDCIELPYLPIAQILTIKYYNTDSPEVLTDLYAYDDLSPDQTYSLVNDVLRRNSGETFPATASRADAVQITYTAGYGINYLVSPWTHEVPENIKAAMFLIIQDLYENREAHIVGLPSVHNKTVDMLLDMERVYR